LLATKNKPFGFFYSEASFAIILFGPIPHEAVKDVA